MSRHHVARPIPLLLACAAVLAVASVAALFAVSPGSGLEPAAGEPAPNDIQARSGQAAVLTTPAELATTSTTAPPAPTTTTAPPAPVPAPQPSSAGPAPAPAPAPAPVVTPAAVAPRPAPAPAPPPPAAPALSVVDRLRAAFESAVPAAWRGAITVGLEPIAGSTSWGWPNGRIQISDRHAATDAVLKVTIAHEFGHLIAYKYGSQSPAGGAPVGWPAYSSQPTEAWADCVSRVMTGIDDPSHGLPSCSGASLSWTATWLAQGPDAHPRTG